MAIAMQSEFNRRASKIGYGYGHTTNIEDIHDIEKNGTGGNWIALPQKIGLKRCGKSCRLKWLNYVRPNIKHGGFTEEEDNIIYSLYISIGSREKTRFSDVLKSKHEETEAYLSEIETAGLCDMQSQNQQLLQQITERDDYNVKGTADAARQYLWLFEEHNVLEFLILAGDHLYRIDYERFI